MKKRNTGINMNLLTVPLTAHTTQICFQQGLGDTVIKATQGAFRSHLISNFELPTAYSSTSQPSSPPGCESWQLHPLDDQHHNSQRMGAKIKSQQSWQRTPSNHSPHRHCPPPHSFVHGCKNKRIQSVVHQKTEQRHRRTLLGLAPGWQRTHLNTLSQLPTTDAGTIQDISASQQDQLLADFTLVPGPDGSIAAS